MQSGRKFVREHVVYLSRAVDAALSPESLGDDQYRIVRLASEGGAGMARVPPAVIDNPQFGRLERRLESSGNAIGASHCGSMRGMAARRNSPFPNASNRST